MRISGITYKARRTHNVRNFIIVSIIVLCSLSLLLMLYSGYVGWNLTHPKRETIPAFSTNTVPDYKEVSFQDINKAVTLKGWLFENRGSDKTVIFAHGYGKNRLQFKEKTIDMVKSFLDKGYNALLFDFRNSGLSGGKLTSVGIYEKDDLLGAIKYVKAQGSKQVVVIGFSMGASVGIVAASETPDVDALIADSPFTDLSTYLDKQLPVWSKLPAVPFNKTILTSTRLLTGLDTSSFSPRDSIKNYAPRPLLFIHSKDDPKISVENSRELYNSYSKLSSGKTDLWEPVGAEHPKSYEKYPQEYMDRVFKFLSSTLPAKK